MKYNILSDNYGSYNVVLKFITFIHKAIAKEYILICFRIEFYTKCIWDFDKAFYTKYSKMRHFKFAIVP